MKFPPLSPHLQPPLLLLFSVILWDISILNGPFNEHWGGKGKLKGVEWREVLLVSSSMHGCSYTDGMPAVHEGDSGPHKR